MTIGTTPAMEARVGHVPRMRPPALRGKVHAACLPLVAAAGIVLVVLAPGAAARGSVAVYGACAVALFAASSAHHLLTSAGRPSRLAERADHAAIFLIIAGTYTPFVILGLGGATRVSVLTAIWVAAAGGAAVRLLACPAPRWLFALLYLTLGWTALSVLPALLSGAGPPAVVLAFVGGGFYSLGALVYVWRRPDPAPRVLGFHEVFHILTVIAFATQNVGVWLLVYGVG